jgi:hypothetical protein
MDDILFKNTVASIDSIYTKASTFPCRVTTQEGGNYVMKLIGTGPGPVALLTEFIGLKIAAVMGLPVPTPKPLYLPLSFPWIMGTDEFDGAVQRSFGWNLGIEYVDAAHPATANEVRNADPAFLKALVAVDRALTNTDRGERNPNVLVSPLGFIAIDFDACLYLRRAIRAVAPQSNSLWADHLLRGTTSECAQVIPVETIDPAVEQVPDQWLEAIGFNRLSLGNALRRYAESWNSIAATDN